MTACAHDAAPGPAGPTYDPAAEVVELCRDLIRIDTTNYGDEAGPGERKAAEHVAALLDEVGIESELYEAEPGRTNVVARWGGTPTRRPGALLLHGHLDVVPADADDWQVAPVLRRDPGRLRLGPRRGRHEGLRRDAALGRAGPRRAPARCRTGRWCSASPPTRRPAATRAPSRSSTSTADVLEGCTEAVGEVGGFSTTVRGRRLYLIEAAEKGMAWMRLTAHGNAGHGSMRQPRQRGHRRSPRRSPGSARTSGRCGSPRRCRCCSPRSASSPAPRRPRRTPRRWSRSSAAPPGCSARSSATPPTRPCSTPATR